MIVGIDGSNVRGGGGLMYLKELLRAAQPRREGIRKVIVWGGRTTLDALPRASWLEKRHDQWLDRKLPHRVLWQRWQLLRLAKQGDCAVLFCPGGLAPPDFRPVVAMCRNLLPFQWRETRRYWMSWQLWRLLLLRLTQAHTFRHAEGVIFLTRHAREAVLAVVGAMTGQARLIPHGINEKFFCSPRPARTAPCQREGSPFRIVYTSVVDLYKHQWHVAEAVAGLRREGFPVELELVGPAYHPAFRRLRATMRRLDPSNAFIRYHGFLPHDRLQELYRQAELCVFASSCENLPNVLLEKMAAGMPIACSNRAPMTEVLGKGGVYFDPEDPLDIGRAIRALLESPDLRAEKARTAFDLAQQYSWRRCAEETFAFLGEVARAVRR